MKERDEHKIYIIPPNFIEGGSLFGGLVKLRNALEAGAIAIVIGLPVFTHFRGGVGILLGPTGGFILSFPIIAFTVGYFYEKFKSKLGIIFGMVLSLIISYIIGTLQFCLVTNSDFIKGITVCVVPFIILDFIKLYLALFVGNRISKRINLK